MRGSHTKGRGCLSYLLGVKKVDLVPLRVFCLKSSYSRSFCGTFKGIELKDDGVS